MKKWSDTVRLLSVHGITFFKLLQNSDFYLAGVTVFWNGTNYLDCHSCVILSVNGFYDLPKCPLPQKPNRAIYGKPSVITLANSKPFTHNVVQLNHLEQ
jgi:hypothetical protein